MDKKFCEICQETYGVFVANYQLCLNILCMKKRKNICEIFYTFLAITNDDEMKLIGIQ